ncbi:MAG: hypothetical protein DRJ68_04335 [Thermoprotei archaeon]|nr:MAG: hypothetical protein DRJ68_04335 [Thermoprotei archaeon]
MSWSSYLEDLDGKFDARLRESRIKTSTYEEGRIVLTSIIGMVEAAFNLEVLDRLRRPCFIAVERPSAGGDVYLIYEVVSASPIHYQQLSMDVSMPKALRLDFLDQIYSMWGKTEDAWIDILSVYTGYVMKLSSQEPLFERDETFVPLVGARVYLLSNKAVDKFINVDRGVELGRLLGFDLELKVDLERLIKYHGGTFGFTGTGKSNLTSLIVRKIMNSLEDTRVVIVDVAGEYVISLLDLVAREGVFYSIEDFKSMPNGVEALLASQAVPETLVEALEPHGGYSLLEEWIEKLFDNDKVKLIDLVTPIPLTLKMILERFETLARDDNPANAEKGRRVYQRIIQLRREKNLPLEEPLLKLARHVPSLIDEVKSIIESEVPREQSTGKRGVKTKFESAAEAILETLERLEEVEAPAEGGGVLPEDLAKAMVSPERSPKLTVLYIPDPYNARVFTERFIKSLLEARKRQIKGPRVLVVLDEAQEFIPDRQRADDYTSQSNVAVEQLLRQGRKYRLHCWISTQRVAHLNVNAVQQIHSYFAGTLPRSYDRHVIAEAAGVSPEILDKTALLDVGEWLLISYKATRIRGVPVFIKAPDNEKILVDNLVKLSVES